MCAPPSCPTYFGVLVDFPIAMIAAYGLKIVGTKYLPPMFPTELTEKVPSSKSLRTSSFAFTLRTRSLSSKLIYLMDLPLIPLMLGVVKPSFESMATAKL